MKRFNGLIKTAVLRMVFRGLDQRIENGRQLQRILADESQFVPELIDFPLLSLVQQQSHQMLVFAVELSQCQHFIGRHDLRVTQRDRKQLAVSCHRRSELFLRRTFLSDQNGFLVRHRAMVRIERCDGRQRRRRCRDHQPRLDFRLTEHHVRLNARVAARLRIERGGRHQRPPCGECTGQAQRDDRRCSHAK